MGKFLLVLMALAVGCGEPAAPGHHVGNAMTPNSMCIPPLNPVTGNNATITIYDTTVQTGFRSERIGVSMRYDQAVTVNYQIERIGSVTWRTMNNNGSGDSVAANTDTYLDYLVLGSRNRVQVVTGSTGPTTTVETEVCLPLERPLAM